MATSTLDLRRFLASLACFLLPVAGLFVAEQVALGRGWLTFRVWEQVLALTNMHAHVPFPGPFYPRQRVSRTEEGDLGHHTALAQRRTVTWQTDRYGYRNADSTIPPTVVVVGDSMIAGSSLDQSEILSVQLAREMGVEVVNLAPTTLPAVLAERRFLRHLPKVIIEGMAERHIEQVRSCVGAPPPPRADMGEGLLDELGLWWWVARDRQMKQAFLSWAKSSWSNQRIPAVLGRDQLTLFSRGDAAHAASLALIDQGAQALAHCRVWLSALGVFYLPFIVPDKETVYWDLLPSGKKPATYARALAGLAAARLPVIDLDAAFAAERQRSPELLYPQDESHWSARAVALTSRMLAEALRAKGALGPERRGL